MVALHELWAHASNHDGGGGRDDDDMGIYIVDSMRFPSDFYKCIRDPHLLWRFNVSFRHDPLRVLTVKSWSHRHVKPSRRASQEVYVFVIYWMSEIYCHPDSIITT